MDNMAIMGDPTGITIGDKHTYRDWGLEWLGYTITSPAPKTKLIEVPGRNGAIDLSESLTGGVCYNNRTLNLQFTNSQDYESWHSKYSEIANYCHGKKLKIILDTDPHYYYYGRLTLDELQDNNTMGQLNFSVDADPFKYEHITSSDDWLWDDFHFPTDVVRNYKDIPIIGKTNVKLIGTNRAVAATVTCSAAMQVVFDYPAEGLVSIDLSPGDNRDYHLVVNPGEQTWKFVGAGTVTITFRGCSL